jgi:iron complex outermembrane recepter protein
MRIVCLSLALALAVVALPVSGQAVAQHYNLNIPRQPLEGALKDFAAQTGLQIARFSDAIDGRAITGPLSGELSAAQALESLLAPQGLTYKIVNERTIAVIDPRDEAQSVPSREAAVWTQQAARPIQLASAEEDAAQPQPSSSDTAATQGASEDLKLEEIVVTGTHIRGARPVAPVLTITQEEMRLSGHTTLGEVVRSLPQNFGGQNPEVGGGSAASLAGAANQNVTGASSINLRGLGPDATLVLLNGTRLPYDGNNQATDVSVVPLAAIDRIEVLLGGASSIYGSDAVGGVANLILKRDFEGAELAARYGFATAGGDTQTQYSGVAGTVWDSGGFLITGDYSRNAGIRAPQRDYLGSILSRDLFIYPEIAQRGSLLSGHQALGARAEIGLDAFYTQRETTFASVFGPFRQVFDPDSTIYGFSPALNFKLPLEWALRVHGFTGRNESKFNERDFDTASDTLLFELHRVFENEAEEVGVEAQGALFTVAGGDAKLGVGGGYRANRYENSDPTTDTSFTTGSRHSVFGYAELDLPWISPDQDIRGVEQFKINVAARYEDYSDFGEITTPQIGVVWGVTASFDVRASWGKSFKAPTLLEQHSLRVTQLLPAIFFGASNGPSEATVLLRGGGNPDLDAERADVLTVGFVLHPEFLAGTRLEVNFFDIDYSNRVVSPFTDSSQALSDPVYAEFIASSPSTADQTAIIDSADLFIDGTGAGYDPAQVVAIIHAELINAAKQKAQGLDVALDHTRPLFAGNLTASLNASWLDAERRLTRLAAELPVSGVAYLPAQLRARGGVSWSRQGLTLASYLNYVDGVDNSWVTPSQRVSSMTTVDLVLDYRGAWSPIGDLGINLAVANAFNQRPPFVQPSLFTPDAPSYDPTNYSAVGRTIGLTLSKRF